MMRDVYSLSETERKEHEKKFGSFNDFPPNWKPATEDEFWGLYMTYSPEVVEHRQMLSKGKPAACGKLFFYHGGEGLALIENYDIKLGHQTPKLFKFAACEHDMVPVPEESYMCYHVSRCTKCGHKHAVDSSG